MERAFTEQQDDRRSSRGRWYYHLLRCCGIVLLLVAAWHATSLPTVAAESRASLGRSLFDLPLPEVLAIRVRPSPLSNDLQVYSDFTSHSTQLAQLARETLAFEILEGSSPTLRTRGNSAAIGFVLDNTLQPLSADEASALSLELGDIERIEIMRGPATALYGPTPYDTVISITRTPSPTAPKEGSRR